MKEIEIRKSGTDWKISRDAFMDRFHQNFFDPYFDSHRKEINELSEIAYKTYLEGRKAPKTKKAGSAYKDPNYELSIEWLKAKEEIDKAQKEHDTGSLNILLINASHRNDHTCPGEISKSSRLFQIALETFKKENIEVDILDLSTLTSEYGKKIHPCKGCVSTAMPLCHWPCSCYPNHYLGQVQDYMNEIYPKWVRAHGVMIITPVYWHQSPSALKLMIDRLVCADGGNPDPSSTQGKDPELAKKIELEGWEYPRHLKGRCFSVIVHGDTMGVDDSKSALCDWLEEMELIPTGNFGNIGRYIGYFGPYATSHMALDKDEAIQEEVKNSAKNLVISIRDQRNKKLEAFIPDLKDPRPK